MSSLAEGQVYRNFTIRISDESSIAFLRSILLSYLHLRNMLLLLIKRNREEHLAQPESRPNLFKYLTDPSIMRAVLWAQMGGRNYETINFLRSYYAHDSMMQDAMKLSYGLKDKIIRDLVKQVRESWKSFFALRKSGDVRAREPKARALQSVRNYSLPLDMECVSFKKKNKIRLLLGRGKPYLLHSNHQEILSAIGSWKAVKRMELCLKQGEIYLLFSYVSEAKPLLLPQPLKPKYAAMDIGICRLLAIYVHDQSTPSLLIDGQLFSSFNAQYNRKKAKLQSELDPIKSAMSSIQKQARKEGFMSVDRICATLPQYRTLLRKRLSLERRLGKLARRRQHFFDTNFKKLAKRLLGTLAAQGVTHLLSSRNIIEKKSLGSNLGTVQNQRFYHIPFGKLFEYLHLFAAQYGIAFVDSIDEAYTSKTSALSGDIVEAQRVLLKKDCHDAALRSAVFQGKRVKRGLFEDEGKGLRVHADINAALNILHLYLGLSKKVSRPEPRLFKLANPRLIGKKALLCLLDSSQGFLCVEEKLGPPVSIQLTELSGKGHASEFIAKAELNQIL